MGSPGAGKATTVAITIRFLDDEIMEGKVATISLDQPNLELEMLDQASNNERALIPLPSIKRIALGTGAPTAAEQARAEQKVAIRFQDGEVLKGYLDGELLHATYGVTMRLMAVEKDRIETLGSKCWMRLLYYRTIKLSTAIHLGPFCYGTCPNNARC